MLEYVLKLAAKHKATDAVARLTKETRNQVRFSNNTLSTFQTWDTQKLDIFLSFNKRIVFTSLDTLDKKSVSKAISTLVKLARVSKPKTDFGGIAKGPFKYKKIARTYDKRIANVDISDKASLAINAALNKAAKTAGVLYTSVEENHLLTSNNISAHDKGTSIEISIRAFDKKEASGHAVSCSRTLRTFDPEGAGAKAAMLASLSKKPREGMPGKYDVLFDPLAFADLAALTAIFSSAFYVESGFSFLKGKLGKQVASPAVTLYDSGNIPGGFGSIPFDDEGVPTRTTEIIKEGTLNTYLHNTSTAKKYLVKTTANAGLINPAPHNVILQPGTLSKDDIISDAKSALYITNIWYTRFQNYMTGDFSTIPRDAILLIRNGTVVGSLKNIRISENLEALLKKVTAVSNRPEWIHWWEVETPVYLPYVFAEKVNITKPTI